MLSSVSTSKKREKITFSIRLKQAMAQNIKTMHLAFIHTCKISLNTKKKSKKYEPWSSLVLKSDYLLCAELCALSHTILKITIQ